MHTFRQVIDLWPAVDELANDIGKKPNTVSKWRIRDSIPASEWSLLIKAAQRRGIKGVNAETLTKLASRH